MSLTPSLSLTRTSGYAPLGVGFDLTGSSSTQTSLPFHELLCVGDYADTSAGSWQDVGQANLSKNEGKGLYQTHIYEDETGGTYDPTFNLFDGVNVALIKASDVGSSISVSAVSSLTEFHYVSTDGSFTGAPAADATHIRHTTSSFTTALGFAGTNKALLFQRGQSWTSGSIGNFSVTGPGYIGAFGSGAKPIITATSGITLLKPSAVDDWRVVDLDLRGGSISGSAAVEQDSGIEKWTFLRVDARNISSGYQLHDISISSLANWTKQIFIHDGTINNTLNSGPFNGMFLMVSPCLSIQGMTFTNINDHAMRIHYAVKGVLANNNYNSSGVNEHTAKIGGPCQGGADCNFNGIVSSEFTQYLVVSQNRFGGGSVGGWLVSVGPQNANANENVRDVVVEDNWWKSTGGSLCVRGSGVRITYRNNLFDMSNMSGKNGILLIRYGIENSPDFQWLYNNTFYSSASTPDFQAIEVDSSVSHVIVKNNVAYAPNHSTRITVQNDGSPGLVSTNNSTQTGGSPQIGINPGGWSSPGASRSSFQINTSGYAFNGGASVPVWTDAFSNFRLPQTYSIGFHQNPAGADPFEGGAPTGESVIPKAAHHYRMLDS